MPQKNADNKWNAKWIWHRRFMTRPWNSYALFRKSIELPSRPRRAIVRIAADARYILYVNGQRVSAGPARFFTHSMSYDTVDLAPYLQTGTNTLCAICHQYGVSTFFYTFRDISGFLLDGIVETDAEPVPLHTPTGWLAMDCRAWRKDVARLSLQSGFAEHFDADAMPSGWMDATYEPDQINGWNPPATIGPVGAHPWLAMEERGVPLLTHHLEPFRRIVAQFHGANARGYKVADDVYHLPRQESPWREKKLSDKIENMLSDDSSVAVIQPPPEGEYVMLVLDPGVYRTGHFVIDIADAAGDEIIDIIYTEDIEKNEFPMIFGKDLASSPCEIASADRYRCRTGPQKWETFHYKGMRYCTLALRNLSKPLSIRFVGIRQVHAAVEQVGKFECSDATLNGIWNMCLATQYNCLFDSFVDCPSREQAQWWGDARVQARVTLHAFGDSSIFRRGIRQMAMSQATDGALIAHPPADCPNFLPDFMMTWVATLLDYYHATARTDILKESLPVLHKLMQFFQKHELRDGLVGSFDGFWVFLDWQQLHRDNFSGVLNIMYLLALRSAAQVCELAGDAKHAAQYKERADSLAASIEKYFYDPKAKVWRDGWDQRSESQIAQVSQHMNTFAILLNLKPETHAQIARDVLLKSAYAKKPAVLTGGPFFYSYVLAALDQVGLQADVIDLIGRKWGAMLKGGATTCYEHWEPKTESRCHAWSAAPLYLLHNLALGVKPAEPGWKKVIIAPVPGSLDFARGTVGSPLGPIMVDWEKVGDDQLALRIDLPAGMTGTFISPQGVKRELSEGKQEFHT